MVKQKLGKRILSLVMVFCIAATVFSLPVILNANAATTTAEDVSSQAASTELAENVQDGQILQCWNWSYQNIKNNMKKIAEQGFCAIQTSPVQSVKENTSGRTMRDVWWVLYQPTSFSIASSQNALGTPADFKAMCSEAHKYGVKVIVDAVLNHMANQSKNDISPSVFAEIRNDSSCWHDISKNSWYATRHDITQYCMDGLPDLNTSSSKVQNYAISYLKECIDNGADGFRFDGAKHIETPVDSNCASQYWPNVLNAATTYAKSKRGITPYYYGEVLDGPTGSQDSGVAKSVIGSYTSYMSLTASSVSDDIRNKLNQGNASAAARSDFEYYNGGSLPAGKAVLWNESHDTYQSGKSKGISDQNINKAWALVGSRAQAAGMYFARPNNYDSAMMGAAGVTAWSNPEVKAVNQFKSYFIGQNEYLSSSGSIAYNERGTSGVVLVNCSGGSTSVSVGVKKMADGVYTDQITGNTFTVSGGQIKGQIGSTGIAVVYNAVTQPSVKVSKASGTYPATKAGGISVDLSLVNATSGTYKINGGTAKTFTTDTTILVGEGVAFGTDIKLTVTATDGSTTSDPQIYTYQKRDPSQVQRIYFDNSTYKWSQVYCYIYNVGEETNPTGSTGSTGGGTGSTIKFTDSLNWGSVNAYFFSSSGGCGAEWPGSPMKKYETNPLGQSNYQIDIPNGATHVVFNHGGAQTIDLPLAGVEGYYLDGSQTGGKYNGTPWDALAMVSSGKTLVADPIASGADAAGNVDVGYEKWPGTKMTLDSETGYYVMDVPTGYENAVVMFSDGNDDAAKRYPAEGEDGLPLNGNTMLLSANHSWKVYQPVIPTDPTTTTPTETTPTTPTETEPTIPTETEPTNPYTVILLGDVNDDGDVTLVDAVLVQKAALGKVSSFNDRQIAASDVNSDGKTNLADAILIQKYTLKFPIVYPIGERVSVII